MSKLIQKSKDTKLKQALFVVMVPDEEDTHGDITSAEEIAKACHNFNKFCRKANLFHIAETDAFDIAESYIAPVEMQFGEEVIKAGTWLAMVQVNDDELWADMESGEVAGLSIGAIAAVETIEE
jgi:hypothetical protein